jgi:hypothetical protein
MNDFKDKVTKRERLYVYLVALLFLIGFGLFLLQFIFKCDSEFDIGGHSGTFINILGALICGYTLSCECTIIHYLLNAIRQARGFVKVVLIVLFIPALSVCLVASYIATIPYCYYTSNKIKRIQMDNKGVFSKSKIISIIVFFVIDIIITIVYFALV